MSARIVVHVGPGKTGSSALQQWLTTHAEILRQAGVLYPPHGVDRNGVSSGNRRQILEIARVGGEERHVVSAPKASALRAALAASGCDTLLLSSESFCPAVLDIQKVFPEAEFVFYVRDPVEVMESGYNQGVKRHDETRPLVARAFHADALAQLRLLLAAEVPPRLVLRPYGEPLFVGGNIVRDLLHVLEVTGLQPEPQRINASYTFDALEFKRHVNHFALGPIQTVLDTALQAYSTGLRSYSMIPPETFAEFRAAALSQLDQLIADRSLEALVPLRKELARLPQRPYVRQAATREQLFAVADHLEVVAPEAFADLRARVRGDPDRALPNPEFHARFQSP